MANNGLFKEQINQLLKPGYLDLETGYTYLPDGQMFIATLVQMPRCKGAMVEWWFGTYLKDTEAYRMWEPHDHLYLKWDSCWKPGHYIGASHIAEIRIAGVRMKMTFKFYDPAEWFDTSRFKESRISLVICGEGFLPDGTLDGRLLHLVRDTEEGCEMRSRFWISPGPELIAKGHMDHCLSEMAYLSDFLPALYAREHQKGSGRPEKTKLKLKE